MLAGFSIVVGVVILAILCGEWRWKSLGGVLRARLEAARRPMASGGGFDPDELEDLPAPVRRYFQAVLSGGQPMVSAVSVGHDGNFNMSESAENWKPFKSSQRVVTHRPGFVWDARIMMVPGMPVRVVDAYVAGEGILHAAVFGLISMANLRDSGEMARGELIRYFSEAAWYPTALLPSQGIRWQAVDAHSASATLKDGEIEITLLFRFNDEGLIATVHAAARGRSPGVSMPWQGRFWNYALRDGMRVPLEAEAAWLTPEGVKPYWRGKITSSCHEFS